MRTFLLLISKQADVLSGLQRPGSSVWLFPKDLALREGARKGTGSAYDAYSRALPLGTITAPTAGLEVALKHVGYSPEGSGDG